MQVSFSVSFEVDFHLTATYTPGYPGSREDPPEDPQLEPESLDRAAILVWQSKGVWVGHDFTQNLNQQPRFTPKQLANFCKAWEIATREGANAIETLNQHGLLVVPASWAKDTLLSNLLAIQDFSRKAQEGGFEEAQEERDDG